MANAFSMLGLVLKRLRHNLGLTASAMVGMAAILTIAVCVPIFADAVSGNVLRNQLTQLRANTNLQLFSLRLVYQEKSPQSMLDVDKVEAITRFLKEQFQADLGLPLDQVVTDVQTGNMVVTDLTHRWPEAANSPLGQWDFLIHEMLPQHAQIAEGKWPDPDSGSSGPIQIAVPLTMADEMLLKIGDHFLMDNLEVEVVGFWNVTDLHDPFWYTNPNSTYSHSVWVPMETYLARVKPAVSQPVQEVTWYLSVNNERIQFQQASQYLYGLTRLNVDLKRLVEGIQDYNSPLEALEAYQKRADSLATLFYVVGSPMLVLALIFIGLTARISVQQYENETAILRARGTSRIEIMLLNLVETIMLFVLVIPLSLAFGWLAANVMNQTVSFLQFTTRQSYALSLGGLNVPVLAAGALIIAGARFLPVISASRVTVLRVKQDQSRGSQKPFWERFYLDFLLLLPGLYAFFTLKGWTKPAQFLSQLEISSDQQFRDPLLFVAPALFAIALSMVIVRFIPLIVRLLAAIANRLPGAWAYLSLQQIARRSQDHSSALLLIIIALALSIFTVSTARTLDRWLYDSEYYKVGADMAVKEYIATNTSSAASGSENSAGQAQLMESFLTVEEHRALPGVTGAARVGKYDATFSSGRGETACSIIGVDRIDFVQTAFFRDDFANENLGALMNALGSNLDGVLVPNQVMLKNGIALGDQLSMSITVGTAKYNREMFVVGSYDYFPTVFPKDKPALIANLESIFNYPEDVEGYQMWLSLKPDADIHTVIDEIAEGIGNKQAVITLTGDAADAVSAGQDKPERMGLFGILNVGFFATGLMPGIGFLIYSYAALRRRFIQLGILQAIGLSVRQLIASLVTEQVILMGLAILSGAAIGLVTSMLFVPFMQTGATPGAPVPPFQVIIGWAEAGWLSLGFGLVLSLTMAGTIIYLASLKVFQAVKLGETL
jgi:putative ABC transport system permease protein